MLRGSAFSWVTLLSVSLSKLGVFDVDRVKASVHVAMKGRHRATQNLGGLIFGAILDISKNKGRSLSGWETLECRGQRVCIGDTFALILHAWSTFRIKSALGMSSLPAPSIKPQSVEDLSCVGQRAPAILRDTGPVASKANGCFLD